MKRLFALLLCFALCLVPIPAASAGAGEVEINEANFPDPIFRGFVTETYDTDGSGRLSEEEIAAATKLEPDRMLCYQIKSIKGVEYFTELRSISVESAPLTELDLSKNTALEFLNVGFSRLTELDLSKNTALTTLFCLHVPLKTINLGSNSALKRFAASCSYISELDLSKQTGLEELDLYDMETHSLILGSKPNLKTLSLTYMKLKELDISGCPFLAENVLTNHFRPSSTASFGENTTLTFFCGDSSLCVDETIELYTDPQAKLTAQPQNQSVAEGGRAVFSVTASGSLGLRYQWYFRTRETGVWNKCSGDSAKTDTLTVEGKSYRNGYQYCCEVRNRYSAPRRSQPTTLTVTQAAAKPVITAQPESISSPGGRDVIFTVAAVGAGGYQWQYRTSDSGEWKNSTAATAKTANLALEARAYRNGYQYRCKVSNAAGTVISEAATLTVYVKPTVTTQPKSQTAAVGTMVSFTVKADGGALSYQWYYRLSSTGPWNKCSVGSSATLCVEAKRYRSGYQYRCLVKNPAGEAYSSIVTLTVQ